MRESLLLEVLAADQAGQELRCLWMREMGDYPQYENWLDGTEVAVITQTVGGRGTFVRAEVGDVVLLKPEVASLCGTTRASDVAWCPRVGWNVSIHAYDTRSLGADEGCAMVEVPFIAGTTRRILRVMR